MYNVVTVDFINELYTVYNMQLCCLCSDAHAMTDIEQRQFRGSSSNDGLDLN